MAVDQQKARKLIESIIGKPDAIIGQECDYLCPFCRREKRRNVSHLHVNYVKGFSICHGCLYGAKSLHGLIFGLMGRVPDELSSVVLPDSTEDFVMDLFYPPEKDKAVVQVKMPESFVPLVGRPKKRLGRVVLDYLTGRGVPYERLSEVSAGYCTDGPFRGYAVFPIHVEGKLVTYTSRRVVGLGPKTRHAKAGASASLALFNYDNLAGSRRIFIGEGPFDAWAFHRRLEKTDGGTATLGTRLHEEQAVLLAQMPSVNEYIVCYDSDANDKAVLASGVLAKHTDRKISVIQHAEVDPDELSVKDLRRLVETRVQHKADLSEIEAALLW